MNALSEGRSAQIYVSVCQMLWPPVWLGLCSATCRMANDFVRREDVRMKLVAMLPEDAFALTSPLWRLLRCAVQKNVLHFLEPAFNAMAAWRADPQVSHSPLRGNPARLLGRCFTLASHRGDLDVVAAALRCSVDVQLRINGQSALDGAVQAGHSLVVETLLAARAEIAQTAPMRWTPLMRAVLGGHAQLCNRLMEAKAPLDEWADRATALDVAEANGHISIAKLLEECEAKRYRELKPTERDTRAVPPAERRDTRAAPAAKARLDRRSGDSRRHLRPGPQALGGGLPRGILGGTVVLHLRADESDEFEDAGEERDLAARAAIF